MWTEIAAQITKTTGAPFEICDRHSVGGGCINQGARLSDGTRRFFVKTNRADQVEMFAAEALGLQQMRQTHAILVPEPICWGTAAGAAYLVLEWLELGRGSSKAWTELGRQLAKMHQFQQSTAFGWERDNTIGSTPQLNAWTASWSTFFTQQRIGYQLQLAQRRGGSFAKATQLLDHISHLLRDHKPQPAIVHGDLWSGNAAVTTAGVPVIFDPAVYWGDREVDLAMTELFGGFPSEFYRGYQATFPLDAGYEQRKTLYNLYHILNHFNLFGGSYGAQANRMIDQILRN
jgi:fructosamine-3-kinase